MTTEEILKILVEKIHSTVVATVDNAGRPVTCTIDMMDCDSQGLYFLTAKGKSFYDRLKKQGVLALTGNYGKRTMDTISVSIQGEVREIGPERLMRLFEKNPYMYEIYPKPESRSALTVFQIYKGQGEWFDLSKLPIERICFTIGDGDLNQEGYTVSEACSGCESCLPVCPQNSIQIIERKAKIDAASCLHCGNCFAVCPEGAVIRDQEAI